MKNNYFLEEKVIFYSFVRFFNIWLPGRRAGFSSLLLHVICQSVLVLKCVKKSGFVWKRGGVGCFWDDVSQNAMLLPLSARPLLYRELWESAPLVCGPFSGFLHDVDDTCMYPWVRGAQEPLLCHLPASPSRISWFYTKTWRVVVSQRLKHDMGFETITNLKKIWDKIHIRKFTILIPWFHGISFMAFNIFTRLYSCPHQFQTVWSRPERKSPSALTPRPDPRPLTAVDLLPVSAGLLTVGISYQQERILCSLLGLAASTRRPVFSRHPCCSSPQRSIPRMTARVSVVCSQAEGIRGACPLWLSRTVLLGSRVYEILWICVRVSWVFGDGTAAHAGALRLPSWRTVHHRMFLPWCLRLPASRVLTSTWFLIFRFEPFSREWSGVSWLQSESSHESSHGGSPFSFPRACRTFAGLLWKRVFRSSANFEIRFFVFLLL